MGRATPALGHHVDGDRLVALLLLSLRRLRLPDDQRATQQWLADELGVAAQTVSRWFRGVTRPSDFDIERLRRVLGWTDDEYLALYEGDSGARFSGAAWREQAGLPAAFPYLYPLEWSPKAPSSAGRLRAGPFRSAARSPSELYWNERRTAEFSAALELAGHALVTVPTGHGATTFARALVEEHLERALVTRSIPVLISLEEMGHESYAALLDASRAALTAVHPMAAQRRWNPDTDWVADQADALAAWFFAGIDATTIEDFTTAAIEQAVLRTLVCNAWERVVGRDLAAQLYGVPPSADVSPAEQRIALYRLVARATREEEDELDRAWRAIESAAPWLSRNRLLDTVDTLARAWPGLRLHLVVDLSPTPAGRLKLAESGEYLGRYYLRVLRTATRVVDRIATAMGARHFGVDVVYVVPSTARPEDLGEQLANGYRLPVTPFNIDDAFAILDKRFVDRFEQREGEGSLRSVISHELVRLDRATALSTATWLLDRSIDQRASTSARSAAARTWTQPEFDNLLRRIASKPAQLVLDELRASPDQLEAVVRLLVAGLGGRLPTEEVDGG